VVHTPAAGGPFTITLQASNTVTLENVLIGEVWVLSGQSNMEWSALNNNKQAQDEAPNALNPNLRLFQVPKTTAPYPQDDCPGEWKVCNPDDMRRFSTIGYFFGKRLHEELKVPIGLINASWGGTPAEVWTPREIIENDVQLREAAEQISPTPWWPSNTAYAYNAMIAPLNSYKISGVLWYQGESNTGRANLYPRLFTNMIQSWRKAWKDDFPFYYVQIAPFNYDRPLIGALLREAQTQSSYLPKTGMVVISDLVDDVRDIHPQNKKEVAERLARLAMAETYHKPIGAYTYPSYRNMFIEGSRVRLFFDHAENGLLARNGELTDFMIAGEDRKFVKAVAKIEGQTVIVSSSEVKKPLAVRFGFSNTAMPNLFSREGLPVNLFRTDSWEQ
jgi:sialate O-acetylesterase